MKAEIFRSKRFWTALLGVVSMLLVAFVPELEAHVDTLTPGILAVVGLLIGGYTVQDSISAYQGENKYLKPVNPTEASQTYIYKGNSNEEAFG